MQEILPALEQCWMSCAEKNKIEYKVVNVDETPLRQFMSFLLQSDAIVIIAFNETIARFMVEVRTRLGLTIPFLFHVHGLASIALWPLHHFGVLQLMTEEDSFLVTCPGDLNCLKLISDNLQARMIPFPYYPMEIKPKAESSQSFAYVGRISDQKNIDVVIKAYHLIVQENEKAPPLLIYGKEDFLGSPNMGIKSSQCLADLMELVSSLNLEDKVLFKDFVQREVLYGELGGNHIFVSASSHSDENFGMALMRSLSLGATAAVSEWGGHILFGMNMPEKVKMAPVSFAGDRPRPEVEQFKEAMKAALAIKVNPEEPMTLPAFFSPDVIADQFRGVLKPLSTHADKLQLTSLALSLFEEKKNWNAKGDLQKVFSSYQDPKAKLFLQAYRTTSG